MSTQLAHAQHFVSPLTYLTKTRAILLCYVLSLLALPVYYKTRDPIHIVLRLLHHIFIVKNQFKSLLGLHSDGRHKLSNSFRAFEDLLRARPVAKLDAEADPAIAAVKIREKFAFSAIIPADYSTVVSEDHRITEFGRQLSPAVDLKVYVIKADSSIPDIDEADKLVYYCHGGAYMLGNLQGYKGFCSEISKRLQCPVVYLEYGLVPEHPLPYCVHQAVAAWKAVLHYYPGCETRSLIMGDSAGGGLTLLTLQALIKEGVPTPAVAAPMSPWADMTASGPSYERNKDKDVMIKHNRIGWGISSLFGGKKPMRDNNINPADAIYSPVNGSFDKFPPMLITVGTAELLESDARTVYRKARAAGVDVDFIAAEHMCHVHSLMTRWFSEADKTLNQILAWAEIKLGSIRHAEFRDE